ncbi:hypothetical protein ACFFQ7_14865, partial [Roseibacillus persicicus]
SDRAGESEIDWRMERDRSVESARSWSDWVCLNVRLRMSSQDSINLLPTDLREYLSENSGAVLALNPAKRSHVNVENVRLKRLNDLEITEVPLDSADYGLNWESHGLDPSTERLAENRLFYKFRIIDLIAEELDGRFGEYGIFSWFCDLERYGTWDETHYVIYTFPETTWSDIMKEPMKYINAQWEPDNVVCELLVPWLEQHLGVDMNRFRLPQSDLTDEPWW